MAHWEGHKADTSTVPSKVIIAAATGAAQPSHSDRILFTACEFWASAQNCTLFEQLREDPLPQLLAAEATFAVVGLAGVTKIVQRGREMLTDDPQRAWVEGMRMAVLLVNEICQNGENISLISILIHH